MDGGKRPVPAGAGGAAAGDDDDDDVDYAVVNGANPKLGNPLLLW